MGADKIATGHNADDVAETVLLNILRGDVPRWAHQGQLCRAAAADLQESVQHASAGWFPDFCSRLYLLCAQAGPLRQHHHWRGFATAARQALQGALCCGCAVTVLLLLQLLLLPLRLTGCHPSATAACLL